MPQYSDFVERIFLQPNLLGKLCPTAPLLWELPKRIRDAEPQAISGGKTVTDQSVFALVRGALFFAVDDLDAAHRIFQDEKSDLGSYCHGMLHRREPDFENARHWFRRAGRQPFFQRLHREAAEHSAVMSRQSTWDPYLFTGECGQARHGAEEKNTELTRLQRTEFEVLFDYCWRQAVEG